MNVVFVQIEESGGIVIPDDMLKRLDLKSGDLVELSTDNDVITLRRANEDLSRQIEAAHRCMEKYRGVLQKLAEYDRSTKASARLMRTTSFASLGCART